VFLPDHLEPGNLDRVAWFPRLRQPGRSTGSGREGCRSDSCENMEVDKRSITSEHITHRGATADRKPASLNLKWSEDLDNVMCYITSRVFFGDSGAL
jgi:hypothetical protein